MACYARTVQTRTVPDLPEVPYEAERRHGRRLLHRHRELVYTLVAVHLTIDYAISIQCRRADTHTTTTTTLPLSTPPPLPPTL